MNIVVKKMLNIWVFCHIITFVCYIFIAFFLFFLRINYMGEKWNVLYSKKSTTIFYYIGMVQNSYMKKGYMSTYILKGGREILISC